MKKVSAEVLNLDVEKLIEMLNAALCEEWLAYYQYWVGARIMEGPMRIPIEAELLEHANEELKHAEMLIERIIQLGGTPVLNPLQWQEMARCKYETPTDPYIETILEQNLRSERCAIKRYQDIADYTSGVDYTTAKMAVDILEDELEHENDIVSFQDDIVAMKGAIGKMVKYPGRFTAGLSKPQGGPSGRPDLCYGPNVVGGGRLDRPFFG